MEDLKKRRKYLRTHVTKLLGKEKALIDSKDIIKVQVLTEQLYEKKNELKQIDKEIFTLTKGTDQEMDKEYEISENYQEQIIEAIKNIELNLKENEEKKENSEAFPSTVDTHKEDKQRTYSARLPKIELPTFHGDITTWVSFWQIFDSNIHQREDLSVIEKLTYLLSLLKDEPARLVSGFDATAENYSDIIKILQSNYGQKNRIVDLNVRRILNMKPVSNIYQVSELKNLITELSINLRNLKNLGINTNVCSPILNTKIKQMIPTEMLLLYERQKQEDENTDDLVKFLETEIKYRESVTPVLDPKAPTFDPSSWKSTVRQSSTYLPRAKMQYDKTGTLPFDANKPWVTRPQHFSGAKQTVVPSTTRSKAHVICYKCGQAGHIAKVCRQK